MGIGFISPTTIIDQLKIKMYVGNIKEKSKTRKEIKILYESIKFNAGLRKSISEISNSARYWCATWLDNIYDRLR